MKSEKTKILIVDDHHMVREGLALRINRESDLIVCGEAETPETALACCETCLPDLALVDLSLADTSGLVLIKHLRELYPQLPILALSMHDENIYAERVFQAGAQGYIMKQEAVDTLIKAMRILLAGQLYVSDALRSSLVRILMAGGEEKSPVTRLTSTEFDIFNLLGMKLSPRQISERLNRSSKTIESHCANIRKKLGLQSGRELTHYAVDWLRVDREAAEEIKIV